MSLFFRKLIGFFSPKNDAARTSRAVLGFGGAATAAIFTYSFFAAATVSSSIPSFFAAWAGVFGALFALGFASFGVGGLLGFLFGIPKSNESKPDPAGAGGLDEDVTESEAKQRRFEGNTNLEEISDWLTKIVIGASLVQIKELLRYLGRVITETAASFERVPFAEAVCGSVLIGYSALGFFFVYLLTRLFLVRAFNDVEKQLERRRYARMMKTMRGEYDFSDAEKHWLKILFASGGTNYKLEIPSDAFTANDEAAITALSERGLVEGIAGPWIPGATVKLTQLGVERQSMLQERVST